MSREILAFDNCDRCGEWAGDQKPAQDGNLYCIRCRKKAPVHCARCGWSSCLLIKRGDEWYCERCDAILASLPEKQAHLNLEVPIDTPIVSA